MGILGIEGDGRALTHPLVESALYRSLPAGERSLLHRRAADLLAGEQADVETVGLHLVHAEPAADPQTVTRLRAAAGRAHVRGAPEAAATFLRRALASRLRSASSSRTSTASSGSSWRPRCNQVRAHHLREAVALAVTPEQRLRIALSGSRAVGLAGHFDDAIEIARQGLAERAGDADLRGQLELEMVCSMMLAADTVEEGYERVRAHRPADRDSLWRIPLAWEAAGDGCRADDVRGLLEPVIDAVTPPRGTDSLASTWAKFILIANGDFDAARRLCDSLVELARPQGWLIALAHGSFVRAIVYMHMGRIHEARADAEVSFRFKMANSPPAALLWSLFPLVEALTELGELDEADSALEAGLPTGDPPEGCLSGAHLLERRAQLRMAQGRYDEAHADLVRAADWWQRLQIQHPATAAWRVIDAEALVALGDRRAARDLAVAHLELADGTGLPEPRGAGLRALALTAEPEEAVELLERAVGRCSRPVRARLEHTRALVALGAALRRVNRRSDAREPLRQALDQAQRGGMRLLADRARHELQAAGARPRRTALTGIDSLTPSERQVADLAAQGHGNREIAQRLYVTRRTVETHLTHAFGKLGVSSRSDLVELPRPGDRPGSGVSDDFADPPTRRLRNLGGAEASPAATLSRMQVEQHLAGAPRGGRRVRHLSDDGGARDRVPTTPDWDVRRLLAHQGMVHRWATGTRARRAGRPRRGRARGAGVGRPGGLAARRRGPAGHQRSRRRPTTSRRWCSSPTPRRPKRFWARRQCHETTIHAVDALSAALGRYPRPRTPGSPRDVALDGIDELLTGFLPRPRSRLRADEPDDDRGAARRRRRALAGRGQPSRPPVTTRGLGDEEADVVLRGSAVALYLTLWNRSDEIRDETRSTCGPRAPG